MATASPHRHVGGVNGGAIPSSLTEPSSRWLSPGAGVSLDHDEHALGLRIFIAAVTVLAVYNALELTCMALLTFRRYHGLYFYSVLVSAIAIIPYTVGFALDLLDITTGRLRWAAVTLITLGWWPMITGQALVLWSRLHLIVPKGPRGERIVRWTGWMMVFAVVVFHLPTTVFTFGSSFDWPSAALFARGYNVMEKTQMAGFFCQEVLLSSVYIVETIRILRSSLQPGTRKIMRQLLAINAAIIVMDLGLLGLEAASYYILETMLKGVVYSIKLKLEFAILGKLVDFVGRGQRPCYDVDGRGGEFSPRTKPVGFMACRKRRHSRDEDDEAMFCNMDHISEFVDLEKVDHDITRPSRSINSKLGRRSCSCAGFDPYEVDGLARFEYVEDVEEGYVDT